MIEALAGFNCSRLQRIYLGLLAAATDEWCDDVSLNRQSPAYHEHQRRIRVTIADARMMGHFSCVNYAKLSNVGFCQRADEQASVEHPQTVNESQT